MTPGSAPVSGITTLHKARLAACVHLPVVVRLGNLQTETTEMTMKMRLAMLVLFHASVAARIAGSRMDNLWETYKLQHNKNYTTKEDRLRRQVWQMNVKLIQEHNLAYDLGLHTFSLGVNHLADWTFEEYQKYLLGARPAMAQKVDNRLLFPPQPSAPLPDHVDWRDEGYVTPVKDQGQCGSCWAFSSTGALEGQHFKKTGVLTSLSEQNLVDCVTANFGCSGGFMDGSFNYVKSNGGIDTEGSYPYVAKQGTCHYNSSNSGSTCSGHVDITHGDEHALQEAVATIGPISVGIDASHKTFMLYKSGIYYDSSCSHNQSDHAVLAVGYGQENGYDYWLVKNSWSWSWGEQGYIKMARNVNNMCGIASHASYPLV